MKKEPRDKTEALRLVDQTLQVFEEWAMALLRQESSTARKEYRDKLISKISEIMDKTS